MCRYYSMHYNEKDPSFIVIDEVVGMSIALFMLPKIFYYYFISLILFRIFDIFKPSVIFHSQYMKNGLGIMMDDLISGFLVSLLLFLYIGNIY